MWSIKVKDTNSVRQTLWALFCIGLFLLIRGPSVPYIEFRYGLYGGPVEVVRLPRGSEWYQVRASNSWAFTDNVGYVWPSPFGETVITWRTNR